MLWAIVCMLGRVVSRVCVVRILLMIVIPCNSWIIVGVRVVLMSIMLMVHWSFLGSLVYLVWLLVVRLLVSNRFMWFRLVLPRRLKVVMMALRLVMVMVLVVLFRVDVMVVLQLDLIRISVVIDFSMLFSCLDVVSSVFELLPWLRLR